MPFISTALAIGLGAAAAGSVGSAAIKAHAAGKAADAQSSAADKARVIEQENQQKATDFQTGVWNSTQQNYKPYVDAGNKAINNLSRMANDPNFSKYGSTFQAPTLDEARATPGYNFALQTGSDAITKQAAATGNLMSGNTGTALEQYGQGLADTDYNNLYNQALQTYMTNYNVWNNDTNNEFNRNATVANGGETAVAQEGALGQSAAGNIANIDVNSAAMQAQQVNNAAAARASGYVGSANAWGSGIQGASELPLEAWAAQQNPWGHA